MKHVPWLVVLLGVGCVVGPDEDIGASRAEIVDGTLAPDEHSVVLVKLVGGVGLCTGTFVSPTVVLTAKHCVQGAGLGRPHALGLLSIGVGRDVRNTVDYRIRRVDTTPGTYRDDGLLTGLIGQDVGVVTIRPDADGNLPDVAPMEMMREDPSALVGETFTFIGYGQTPEGGSGTKYLTTGTLNSIDANVLYSSMNICSGDSGGPMILEGSPRRIVGVASFGQAESCPSSRDGHNRIDRLSGIVDEALLEAGDCPGVSDEACNSVDDDCDGTIDETCQPLGGACETDDDCAFAQLPERFGFGLRGLLDDPVVCGDTPAGRVCTHACDPRQPVDTCASIDHPFGGDSIATPGAYCAPTSGCEGTCVAGVRGAAPDGETCAADTDCASLACVDPGDGNRRCVHRCEGGAGQCPIDRACAAPDGACGGCVDPAILGEARGLGDACDAAEQCVSGNCHAEGYCTTACPPDCADGFHCRSGLCERGDLGSDGARCVDAMDCAGERECTATEGGTVCTTRCPSAGDCADGFECDGERCVPAGAVLGEACGVDAECLSGRCVVRDSGGTCTRSCGAAGGCDVGTVCDDHEGELLCVPPPEPEAAGGGGCSVGGGAGAGAAWVFVAMVGLRRRQR